MNGDMTPDKMAVLLRREQVCKMLVEGKTQWDIARHFGVNQSQISRDVSWARKQLAQMSGGDYAVLRGIRLTKVADIERRAKEGFARSCNDSEQQKISTGSEVDSGGDKKKKPRAKGARIEKVTKSQVGNPRFLEIELHCDERVGRITGSDAPQRTEITGPGGDPIQIKTMTAVITDGSKQLPTAP